MNRLTVDGNQGVPRLHAGLLSTTVHHDASDVDVILFGDDLRRDSAQQQHHDESSKEVVAGPAANIRRRSLRGSHQLVRLWFSECAQRQWTKLEQTERTDTHAVAPSEQAMTKFVNHE